MSGTRAAEVPAAMDSVVDAAVVAAATWLRARAEDLEDPRGSTGHDSPIRGRERLARRVDQVRRQLGHILSLEGLADSYSREGALQVAGMVDRPRRYLGALEAAAVEIAYATRWLELSRRPGAPASAIDRCDGQTP